MARESALTVTTTTSAAASASTACFASPVNPRFAVRPGTTIPATQIPAAVTTTVRIFGSMFALENQFELNQEQPGMSSFFTPSAKNLYIVRINRPEESTTASASERRAQKVKGASSESGKPLSVPHRR